VVCRNVATGLENDLDQILTDLNNLYTALVRKTQHLVTVIFNLTCNVYVHSTTHKIKNAKQTWKINVICCLNNRQLLVSI